MEPPERIHRIAGFPAALTAVPLGARPLALWVVPRLESMVDRAALLRGDEEPPYWACLWSGARVLAAYTERFVPLAGRAVLDAGCGLGLTGLAAARAGARVLFVDTAAPALAFVAASLAENALRAECRCGDVRALPAGRRFDLILAAELIYDRDGFAGLADALDAQLAPGGLILIADGARTDTRAFYRALDARGLTTWGVDVAAREEEASVRVRLTAARRVGAAGSGGALQRAREHAPQLGHVER